jgi:hypothetical protein
MQNEDQIEVAQGVFKPRSVCTEREIMFDTWSRERDEADAEAKRKLQEFAEKIFAEASGGDDDQRTAVVYALGTATFYEMQRAYNSPYSSADYLESYCADSFLESSSDISVKAVYGKTVRTVCAADGGQPCGAPPPTRQRCVERRHPLCNHARRAASAGEQPDGAKLRTAESARALPAGPG